MVCDPWLTLVVEFGHPSIKIYENNILNIDWKGVWLCDGMYTIWKWMDVMWAHTCMQWIARDRDDMIANCVSTHMVFIFRKNARHFITLINISEILVHHHGVGRCMLVFHILGDISIY